MALRYIETILVLHRVYDIVNGFEPLSYVHELFLVLERFGIVVLRSVVFLRFVIAFVFFVKDFFLGEGGGLKDGVSRA